MYDSGTLRESLVDMNDDPGEMKNLATLPEFSELVPQHRRYLLQWIEDSHDKEAKAFALGVPWPARR